MSWGQIIVLPHGHEVLGTDNQRSPAVIVLEDSRDRRGHHGLAKADHIAEHDAATPVEMARGDLDRGFLEWKQLVAKIARQRKLADAGTGIFGEVIGHFEIDQIRRERAFAGPTLFNDRRELF